MYDMLTGIRTTVSRCNGKPPRELRQDDFTAAHKVAFDVSVLLSPLLFEEYLIVSLVLVPK